MCSAVQYEIFSYHDYCTTITHHDTAATINNSFSTQLIH